MIKRVDISAGMNYINNMLYNTLTEINKLRIDIVNNPNIDDDCYNDWLNNNNFILILSDNNAVIDVE